MYSFCFAGSTAGTSPAFVLTVYPAPPFPLGFGESGIASVERNIRSSLQGSVIKSLDQTEWRHGGGVMLQFASTRSAAPASITEERWMIIDNRLVVLANYSEYRFPTGSVSGSMVANQMFDSLDVESGSN
jgi:hypothetical protein